MTPRSTATSPASQNLPQDLFPLDFLNFVDATSPNLAISAQQTPELSHASLHSFQSQQLHSDAGPSHAPSHQPYTARTATAAPSNPYGFGGTSSAYSDAGSVHSEAPSRGGSSRGKPRGGGKRKSVNLGSGSGRVSASASTANQSHQQGMMEVEQDQIFHATGDPFQDVQQQQQQQQQQQHQQLQQILAQQNFGQMGSGGGGDGSEGFDQLLQSLGGQLGAVPAGMLQQLEGIHMQSPIVFDPNNPSQPYNPMAQFLNSPLGQSQAEKERKARPVFTNGGLITPGASSEMYPQLRPEQVSPMRLEMFARGELADGVPEANMLPLLSPALTQATSSQFTSPAQAAAFYSQSPLEALQEQQRQFQEQLNALQVQQRQLQATAAAVAAAAASQAQQSSTSPFVGSSHQHSQSGNSSGQTRPVTTPGVLGSTEPSPAYFSPLTSPALEATRHFNAFGNTAIRPPHPLSALSSPALNPVGYNGGAQQTLSPALQPQSNASMNDPDYISTLVGMLDNAVSADPSQFQQSQAHASTSSYAPQQYAQSYTNPNSRFHSPSSLAVPSHHSSPTTTGAYSASGGWNVNQGTPGSSSGSGIGATPSGGAGGAGPGPHRQSLPPKSRPSPLVKPVNHRQHIRQPSNTGGGTSVPSSPLVMTGIQPGTYLPPAAVDQKMHAAAAAQVAASISSTPSPVDLAQIMPPPPVPRGQRVTPITPAALMNLGGAGMAGTAGETISGNAGMLGQGMMLGQQAAGGLTVDTGYGAFPGHGQAQRHPSGQGIPSEANGAAVFAAHGLGTTSDASSAGPGRRYGKTTKANAGDHPVAGESGLTNQGGSARIQAKRAAMAPPNSNSASGSGSALPHNTGSTGTIIPGKRGQKVGPSKRLAARPAGVGVRSAIKGSAAARSLVLPEGETRKTSHKAAEQKRRDSLKAGFDELRLLLPAINTEALDPESGEPIPGSSAPRLLPKSSLVPDDNPNRGVSKVALLKFSNEYIVKLHERVDKRDGYIELLRAEVERLRGGEMEEVKGGEGEDLLEIDIWAGEDDEFGPKPSEDDEDEGQGEDGEDEDDAGNGAGGGGVGTAGLRKAGSSRSISGASLAGMGEEGDEDAEEGEDEGMMILEDEEDEDFEDTVRARKKVVGISRGQQAGGAGGKRNALGGGAARRPGMVKQKSTSSSGTVIPRGRRSD